MSGPTPETRRSHALAAIAKLSASLVDDGVPPVEVRRAAAEGIEKSRRRCRATEPDYPAHVCVKVGQHKGPHRTRYGRVFAKDGAAIS